METVWVVCRWHHDFCHVLGVFYTAADADDWLTRHGIHVHDAWYPPTPERRQWLLHHDTVTYSIEHIPIQGTNPE